MFYLIPFVSCYTRIFIYLTFFSLDLPFTFWHMHGIYHLDLFVLVIKYKLCS